MTIRISRATCVVLLLVAAACSSDDGGTAPPVTTTLASITVTPTLSLQAGAQQTIAAQGIGANGQTMTGVIFAYTSSSAAIAAVSSAGAVIGLSAGSATITVTGTAAGVSRSATVNVIVSGTLPNAATVTAGANTNVFTPGTVAIARGGTVTWTFGALTHNVEFGGTAGAPTNIPITTNASVSRTFSSAGTFNYLCSLHPGMVGTVIVP